MRSAKSGDDVGVEVVDGVGGDGGSDEGAVVGFVVMDFEPEALEEHPQDVVGGVEQVEVNDGELVEQFDRSGVGVLGCLQDGERVELGLPFGFKLAEAVADSGEDGAGGVVFGFEGADEPVLAAGDVVEAATEGVDLCRVLGCGGVVDVAEVGGEQVGPGGSEEPGGEELGHPG